METGRRGLGDERMRGRGGWERGGERDRGKR